ncbi:hypothetical protein I7L49_00925 [Neisseria meningitidis]|nr:hypothetical protein [Neisseria meningitidis]MBH5850328.1 hypothetical protein [Neisseria meningitidis]MBH6251365.1 hypothetical protein [Neisseria meningitidis]
MLIHYKNHLSAVIPTDAKVCLFESQIILHRHSRAGGNPNHWVVAMFKSHLKNQKF